RGGAALAGGAAPAYRRGAAGHAGLQGVASGLGGVARAAGTAATSPLRRAASRAADSMQSSFNAGGKSVLTGGNSTAEATAAPVASGPPDWVRRMRQSQRTTHAVQAAAHAVRSGDAHGGGSSVNLSESDR
ncbi:MAG: P-type conjugative transfer protein TrbL, partial [Geminicoccaceae bacterium]